MMRPARRNAGLLDLDRCLDRTWLKEWISAGLGDVPPIASVDVHFIRPKLGRSMLLGIGINWESSEGPTQTLAAVYASLDGTENAASKAGTLRLVDPPVGPAMAVLRDPQALFLAYPNDRALRGLSAAAEPRRLGNRLHRSPFPWGAPALRIRARHSSVTPVRWKVGRRAVLRASLNVQDADRGVVEMQDVFVRVYPKERLARQLARWQTAARLLPGVMPCRVYGRDAERSFLVIEGKDGSAVHDVFSGVGLATHTIASVHSRRIPSGAPLPVRDDAGNLVAALRPLDDLASWLPEWSTRIASVRERLTQTQPQGKYHQPRFVHGDLKVDQLLVTAVDTHLLDWDEAAIGDPHADYASLAADAVLHYAWSTAPGHIEERAAAKLDQAFDRDRWRWQLRVAFARRALEGLQRGRADWRDTAQCALRHAGGEARATRRKPNTDNLRKPLRVLLDRGRRASLIEGASGDLVLNAVWPDRAGFVAGLRGASEDLWLRVNGRVDVQHGVDDPELPALGELIREGGYRLVSRRPGRRATLAPRSGGDHFVHLRRPGRAAETLRRVLEVQALLDAARIPTAPIVGLLRDRTGWITRRLPGAPIALTSALCSWRVIGITLGDVHRVEVADGVSVRTRHAALDAARRQIDLTGHVGDPLARWLQGTFSSLEGAQCASAERATALVHGDLHPGQIIAARSVALIDWDRAGRGEPEEDLGNLAAHLYWLADVHARTVWQQLREAYEQHGGRVREDVLRFHAQLSLLRVLAVHSWRDADRARCVSGRDLWQRWPEEFDKW